MAKARKENKYFIGLCGSRGGCGGHEVEELAVTQLVCRNAIAFVCGVGILAHEERRIILTVTDGGIDGLLVVSVELTANQFRGVNE